MIWFTLLIPIITVLILLIFFREKVQHWEYAVVIAPSALFILILNYFMIHYRISDTEFYGTDVVAARYYEDWDEWISRTCCRSYKCGKSTCCHYYDCSYRKYHPEYWVMVTSTGSEISISKDYYQYLLKKFATHTYFIDMNRHYYTDDGNSYKTDWGRSIPTAHSVTEKRSYENRIKASHSVFKIEDLKPEEIKRWKLYDYPILNGYSLDYFLGYDQNELENNKLHYLNGYLGNQNQIQTFIMIFKNQPKTVAFKQRSHWEGVNKNEFVICIGVDSLTNNITWCKSFSWMDVPTLAVDVDSYVSSQEKLNVNNLLDYLIQKEPIEWKRKDFKDFDYLKIEVTTTQLYWIIILVTFLNIGISIWVIMNEFENKY